MGVLLREKHLLQQLHLKRGGGHIFEGGLIFGDYSTYVAQEGYKICQLKTSYGTSFSNISMLICRDN